MELAAEHISTRHILKHLNRLLVLNKDLVQTIGRRTRKILLEGRSDIKIKYVHMNEMNIEMMKIIVTINK